MDQEKIGAFISTLRKEQGMTQQQLADAIGVSNKTISKWECGKGMPELALIVPLCHILQISINEFLTGEHLLENGYTEKAEVNMMNLLQETENSKKKSRSSLLAFGITVIIFLFVVLYSVITNMGISMNMLFVDMPTLLSMFLVTALFLLGTNLGLPFFDSFRIVRIIYCTCKIRRIISAIFFCQFLNLKIPHLRRSKSENSRCNISRNIF